MPGHKGLFQGDAGVRRQPRKLGGRVFESGVFLQQPSPAIVTAPTIEPVPLFLIWLRCIQKLRQGRPRIVWLFVDQQILLFPPRIVLKADGVGERNIDGAEARQLSSGGKAPFRAKSPCQRNQKQAKKKPEKLVGNSETRIEANNSREDDTPQNQKTRRSKPLAEPEVYARKPAIKPEQITLEHFAPRMEFRLRPAEPLPVVGGQTG